MACTEYTIEQYNTLNAAIAQGAKRVKYGDKEVEYSSLDDMLRLQARMKACLFPDQSGMGGKTFASFSKGTSRCGRRRFDI